ncbi:putative quinol monooxygenase [Geodermatophilus sp. URMC 61]|uniref:putative quinol monooxygenase n=1 Tax=Geodermatophilus sp. URMC 61 TaxID=3423411 RepID=UPI00406D08A2
MPGERLRGVDARRAGADDGHPQPRGRGRGTGVFVDRHVTHPDPPGWASTRLREPESRRRPASVVAATTPQPEHAQAVREAVPAAVPQVHAEEGCERYALHGGACRSPREDRGVGRSRGAGRARQGGARPGSVRRLAASWRA